jgi:metal-responsive CopG/Arc/MetJ family transcriptional regulator
MLEERKERVSIALYPTTLKLVDDEASRQNRSRSNLIENIIQRHFRKKTENVGRPSRPLARSIS